MRRVCVFCGSSAGARPVYTQSARAMAGALVRRSIQLVYGGGRVGLMGVLAQAVMEGGGQVIGVIPDALLERELAQQDVTELIVVRSMHERKARMAELADGFVALPGGFGTFEEFCEIITWAQLGLHRKPCGILNVTGYYDPLLALFDHAVREGFVPPANRRLVLEADNPDELLNLLITYNPPLSEKWIGEDES